MSETETEIAAAPVRVVPKVYSWRRHDVAADMAAMDTMSAGATAMDRFLSNHAWANPDGSLTVRMTVLLGRCRLWGFSAAQAEAIWEELRTSERWVRSRDKKRLKAVWMEPLREPLLELSETRARAGKASGEARRAKKQGKRIKKKSAPKAAANANAGNDMHTCSTDVEQKERKKERERTTTTDPSGQSVVVVPPSSADYGAPAPAASHAGGAAGAVAVRKVVAPVNGPGRLLRERAEHELQEIWVPETWSATAPIATLVQVLTEAAPEVDVERALFRPCAAWQRTSPDAHIPLLAEISALFAGEDCRDGLLPVSAAPRAIALALHGALIMPERLEPVVLRAVATVVHRTVTTEDPDPLRVACWVAGEFARPGGRSASSYSLACDMTPVPERLFGHRVAGAVA